MSDKHSSKDSTVEVSRVDCRWILLFATLLLGVWTIVAVYAFHPIAPYNAVELPLEEEIATRQILPQGWRFFTRDPREDHLLIFARSHGDEWQEITLGPNFRADLVFGLSRRGRAQSIELAVLMHDVRSKEAWDACERTSAATCLASSQKHVEVTNKSPAPTLCGSVGVVTQQQIPWAWANAESETTMPARVLRLEVKC